MPVPSGRTPCAVSTRMISVPPRMLKTGDTVQSRASASQELRSRRSSPAIGTRKFSVKSSPRPTTRKTKPMPNAIEPKTCAASPPVQSAQVRRDERERHDARDDVEARRERRRHDLDERPLEPPLGPPPSCGRRCPRAAGRSLGSRRGSDLRRAARVARSGGTPPGSARPGGCRRGRSRPARTRGSARGSAPGRGRRATLSATSSSVTVCAACSKCSGSASSWLSEPVRPPFGQTSCA